MIRPSPYAFSTSIIKLKERLKLHLPLRIAFLDIDSTMTIDNKSIITNTVRRLLEKKGYIIVFVTSRTEEILITEKQRELSPRFDRPRPHLGKDQYGNQFYTDPKNTELPGLLDPDILIGSTGTTILVKQRQGGYLVDEDYKNVFPENFDLWRKTIMGLIDDTNKEEVICELHPNEFLENYESGKTNAAPPYYRIELKFKTVKNKKIFVERFKKATAQNSISTQLTDDSNPFKEKYTLYITPKNGTKVQAVEHVVEEVTKSLSLSPEKFELFIAGDSYPDLAMGLYGGKNTAATFLLVGNSRLASFIVDEEVHEFADENLKEIKKDLVALDSQQGGLYQFIFAGSGKRTVIISDEAYPGKTGPESILAYLSNQR